MKRSDEKSLFIRFHVGSRSGGTVLGTVNPYLIVDDKKLPIKVLQVAIEDNDALVEFIYV